MQRGASSCFVSVAFCHGIRYVLLMGKIQDATQPSTAEIVAHNLTTLLTENRWSGRKAAMALGLNPMYVTRRMSGDVECSASDLALFADFLSVPVGAFFLETKKAPTREGEGLQLPGLDSNQEPIG